MRDIPLYEILEFKSDHDRELHAYLMHALEFAQKCSLHPEYDVLRAFRERKSALEQALVEFIDRKARGARKQTVVAFGLAGAISTMAHGDLVGGGLAAGSVLAGMTPRRSGQLLKPYAYVIRFGDHPASGYRQIY